MCILKNEGGDGEVIRAGRVAAQVYTRSHSLWRDLKHDFAVVLTLLQEFVTLHRAIERQHLTNNRRQLALRNPSREPLPGWLHDSTLLRKISKPQPLHTRRSGVHSANIELRLFTRCRPVLNHTSEIAQAA